MRRIALPMFRGGCAFLGGLVGAVFVARGSQHMRAILCDLP